MSTLHYYYVKKKGEAGNDNKVKAGCFWYKRLYNPLTHKLFLVMQFESSDDENDKNYDKTTNTNIKQGGNDGNVQVAEPDVETVDNNRDDAPQVFLS